LAETELGPRGGRSAVDAANVVLAQRGKPTFAPLPAHKDKSKLTGFFKQHLQPVAPKPQDAAASSLASWKSRPWEADEEQETLLHMNPLSMKSNMPKFLSRGSW
jgi:hypothetical protein